jgi:dipeptide/tripeptide permease
MLADFARRLGMGALAGAAVGALCIGVGILRALVAIVFGAHMAPLTSADIRGLTFYVGGFVAAGLLISAIWPLLTSRFDRYVGFSLAGTVVMIAILAADKGGLPAHDRTDWIVAVVLGIVFGCAFGWGRGRGPAA